MGMVVRTNTMAQNAYRQLGMNNSSVGKSLEKLSSGFRINRAADDASGLAISEKMKAQIKGLEQASANSQDGISLIQTAEGATTEIHNMLNRMVELATKSANGTIQDPVDREAIQQEVDDLNSEITRIAKSTNFNGINLIDGNLSASGSGTAVGAGSFKLSDAATDALKETAATAGHSTSSAITGLTGAGDTEEWSFTINATDANGKATEHTFKFTVTGAAGADQTFVAEDGTSYDINATDGAITAKELADAVMAQAKKGDLGKSFTITNVSNAIKLESKVKGEKAPTITGFAEDDNGTAVGQTITTVKGVNAFKSIDTSKIKVFGSTDATTGTDKVEDAIFTVNGKKFAYVNEAADLDKLGKDVNYIVVDTADSAPDTTASTGDVAKMSDLINQKTGLKTTANGADIQFQAAAGAPVSGGLKLQVGDTNQDFNHVTVSVDNLTASGIGTEGLDVSTQDAAGDSVQTIKDAINQVSTNRANLGSLQNRLEYTINNLDTTAENMTAANSRIRDTDMAKEMMTYTKMNILTQSAQAMLAQANQQPQAILQLLQ